MKKKLGLALCVAGILTSSMVFAEGNASQGVPTLIQSQKGPVKIQNISQDQLMVITVEEQNAVERFSVQEGVVSRDDGSGFSFYKDGSTLSNLRLLPVR